MKKNHFLILSFSVMLAYWILDALMNVTLYHTSFWSEFFLTSPHVMPFFKIIIACLLFGLTLTPFLIAKKEVEQPSVDKMGVLHQISKLLFSSLSTKVNVLKSLEALEEYFHLESSLLFVYHQDKLSLYNENNFIKTFFRNKELFPFRVNAAVNEVEKLAITCFLEKRAFSQDTIKLNDKNYTLLSFILKEESSEKALGNLVLVCKEEKANLDYLEVVPKIAEMFAFILSLSVKKENMTLSHTQNPTENISPDHIPGLISTVKLQEYIDQEVSRHKRYHTELTLMIFEINTLQNLINIFPAEIITNLKRDFVQIIKKSTRDTDIFGKWTNDQFALLLLDVDFRAAQRLAKKFQALLEEHKFTRIGKITCSFGITSISNKDTAGTFRTRCENALALASSREGNAVEVKLLV